MKKEYKSPEIILFAVVNKQELLNASRIVNNVNLRLGNGGSVEARSRECRIGINDDKDLEYEE